MPRRMVGGLLDGTRQRHHHGMGESSAAQVVTKGTVSPAFSGTGKGIDLGVTFGQFVIAKQSAKKKPR